MRKTPKKKAVKKKAAPKKTPAVDFKTDQYFLSELINLRREFKKREVARLEKYKQEIVLLRNKLEYYERINRNLNSKITGIKQAVNEYLT